MKRNALRIVCNPSINRISYFFRNELDEWIMLSGNSPLARQYYTTTTIKDRGKEILEEIDKIYNRKNKGVDIFYEGAPDGYNYICEYIKNSFNSRDIVCKQRTTAIAVVGKKKSGKTYLINAFEKFQKSKFNKVERKGYTEYLDKNNNVSWCEVDGVDLKADSIEITISTIRDIQKTDLSCLIYCIAGDSGRIEKIESNLLMNLKKEFPGVTIVIAVTMCYKDNYKDICDEVEKLVEHVEIIPVLAKDYVTRNNTNKRNQYYKIKSFGIDILYTFIFEGKRVRRKYKSDSFDSSKNTIGQGNHGNAILDESSIYRKVIVAGKTAVGKTTLIEKISSYLGVGFKHCDGDDLYSILTKTSHTQSGLRTLKIQYFG